MDTRSQLQINKPQLQSAITSITPLCLVPSTFRVLVTCGIGPSIVPGFSFYEKGGGPKSGVSSGNMSRYAPHASIYDFLMITGIVYQRLRQEGRGQILANWGLREGQWGGYIVGRC